MKKVFLVLVLIGLFCIPVTASADLVPFFTEGDTHLDPDDWQTFPGYDPNEDYVTSSMVDIGHWLEWTVSLNPGSTWPEYGGVPVEIMKGYDSNWAFDLSQNFSVAVDFDYNAGATPAGAGGLNIGFHYLPDGFIPGPENPPPFAGISVENQGDGSWGYATEFAFDLNSANHEEDVAVRSVSSGTLYANYNSGLDTLTFSAEGYDIGEYYGLQGFTSSVALTFAGWSDGVELGVGDARLSDPVITVGTQETTVVPEPISSALFLIGGATMGFRRFRKNA